MSAIIVEEVAPFTVRVLFRQLLVPLTRLAVYLFCFGICLAVDAVVRAFFGTASSAVGWIPYAGRLLSSPLHAIEHKVTSLIGGFESYFEHNMAATWHGIAMLGRWFAAYVEQSAIIDYRWAQRISHLWDNNTVSHRMRQDFGAAKHAEATGHAAQVAATHAQAEAHAALSSTAGATVIPHGRLGGLTKDYAPSKVGGKVAGIESELDHLFDWTIPQLRSRTRAIEVDLAHLYKWMRTHSLAATEAAFAGAVAVALGKLGGGWIRCGNWNKIGRAVCGTPSKLIEALLAGAIDVLVVNDICSLLVLMSAAARQVEPTLTAFVSAADALIGCSGATKPTPLRLNAVAFPVVANPLPL